MGGVSVTESSTAVSHALPPLSLDDLAKIIAAVVVTLYSIGFATIDLYLFRFGTVESEFLRTRFIQVGLAALLPATVSLLHSYPLGEALLRRWHGRPVQRAQFLRGLCIWLLTPIEFFLLLSLLRLPPHDAERAVWALGLSVLPLLPLLALACAEVGHRQIIRRQFSDLADLRVVLLVARMVTVLVTIVSAVPYLLFFAWVVFPQVPPQIGGAEPLPARLVFSSSTTSQVQELGLADSASDLMSLPVELVWETSDWYLVRWQAPTGTTTARLNKGMVSAIVIEQQ
jgi:hypothetical protein